MLQGEFLQSPRVTFSLPLLAATPSLPHSLHQLIKGWKSMGCSCKDSPHHQKLSRERDFFYPFMTATG